MNVPSFLISILRQYFFLTRSSGMTYTYFYVRYQLVCGIKSMNQKLGEYNIS